MSLEKALKESSLHQLLKALRDVDISGFEPVRITLLRNHTADNLEWFLKGYGFLNQFNISYTQSDYDTVMAEVLRRDSPLYRKRSDVILLSLLFEPGLEGKRYPIEQIVEALSRHSGAFLVGHTLLKPLYGQGDVGIERINEELYSLTEKYKNFHLIDANQIEQRLGAGRSRDLRMWYLAKSLLTNAFLNEWAKEILKRVKALKGRAKKVLALDCDNTLWGGVVAEEGLHKIRLDPFDYPGNIYYAFQKRILDWVARGVLVVLCSRNNEADVWDVLEKHPHCLLKRSHLAGWRIHWGDKANDLKELGRELRLSLDHFVFMDDNPSECSWVRGTLPEVTVRQVPKDLSRLPEFLDPEGLFDTLITGEEDKRRTALYQAEAKRREEEKQFKNFDDFLRSLNLEVNIAPLGEPELARAAQLCQKTNQFNLSTKRYTEADLQEFIRSPDSEVFYLHLKDRFGDYGNVGLAILQYETDQAVLDTFLMSCRVLGKRVEETFLQFCWKRVQNRGQHTLLAPFRPTSKNNQVRSFFTRGGFQPVPRQNKDILFIYSL